MAEPSLLFYGLKMQLYMGFSSLWSSIISKLEHNLMYQLFCRAWLRCWQLLMLSLMWIVLLTFLNRWIIDAAGPVHLVWVLVPCSNMAIYALCNFCFKYFHAGMKLAVEIHGGLIQLPEILTLIFLWDFSSWWNGGWNIWFGIDCSGFWKPS